MNETKEIIKLGHQAPSGYRTNKCSSILIEGDLHYCWSHDFVYNEHEEGRKLYNGEPCYFTDGRFYTPFGFNFYKDGYLYNRRFDSISIKAAIRRTLKCKGIPVGTIVNFNKSYYHPGKKFGNSFIFKVKKDNPIDFEYEVSKPSYSANFSNCKRSQKLVEALREKGFNVSVLKDNDNFISSMISTAAAVKGSKVEVKKEDGEVAIAYGHGKKIGFSSYDNNLFGYTYGVESILWDRFDYFNKWSQCNEILKTTSVDEVIKILTEPNPIEE
jgi:hypothetical protein